jgi:hypothetical protein
MLLPQLWHFAWKVERGGDVLNTHLILLYGSHTNIVMHFGEWIG